MNRMFSLSGEGRPRSLLYPMWKRGAPLVIPLQSMNLHLPKIMRKKGSAPPFSQLKRYYRALALSMKTSGWKPTAHPLSFDDKQRGGFARLPADAVRWPTIFVGP